MTLSDAILPLVLSSGFAESSAETTYFAPYPTEEADFVDDYDYSSDSDLEDDTDALYDDWEVELPQPPVKRGDVDAVVPSEVLAPVTTIAADATTKDSGASPSPENGGTDTTMAMSNGSYRTSKGHSSFHDLIYHSQRVVSPSNRVLGHPAVKSSSKTQRSSRTPLLYSRLIVRLTLPRRTGSKFPCSRIFSIHWPAQIPPAQVPRPFC